MAAFTAALRAAFGERLAKAVPYGSRARGAEAHAESDWDVAVLLRDMTDRWAENAWLADITTELMLSHGEVVDAMAFAEGEDAERTPLMWCVRHEGLPL
jgi:predicted nucleotidyltransferase